MRVFVCSPLRADSALRIERNLEFARDLCREVAMQGHSPYAPHLFCTQFLDDGVADERAHGINVGLEFLRVCHELWWATLDGWAPSSGMRREMDLAAGLGVPVRPFPYPVTP